MAAVMADTYRIRATSIWAQARDDYLSGQSAETVCRRHDLGLSAFRRRARKYGWRRSDQVTPPPGEVDLSLYDDIDLEDQAQTARLRFIEALEIGRSTEARRWRRLWLELVEASRQFDADFYRGLDADQIARMRTHEHQERDEEDRALLGPPPPD